MKQSTQSLYYYINQLALCLFLKYKISTTYNNMQYIGDCFYNTNTIFQWTHFSSLFTLNIFVDLTKNMYLAATPFAELPGLKSHSQSLLQ